MRQNFQFHAFATGVAGEIDSPFEHIIESQAPSALSPQGGYSCGRVNHYRFKEIISFQAAYTQVSGGFSEETQSWETVMTSTVEGLQIMGVLKAELIVARLASRHGIEDTEPSIIPFGSRIEGLQIGGVDISVDWHTDLYSRLDTYGKVLEAYREDSNFRKTFDTANYVGNREQLPEKHRRFFPWCGRAAAKDIPNAGSLLSTSLVRTLEHKSEYLPTYGHVIHLPQFGTVALGKFTLDGRARRLTMVEVELGCSVSGRCTASSGETNGAPDPPPSPKGK